MGLVFVQGSALFDQDLEHDKGHVNEGYNIQALSTDIVKLTGDASDLKSKDNINVIGTGRIPYKLKRQFGALDILSLPLGVGHLLHYVTHGNSGPYGTNYTMAHRVDDFGKIVDLVLVVHKAAVKTKEVVKQVDYWMPIAFSLVEDLSGAIKCYDYKCTILIEQIRFNLTLGYDAKDIGVFIRVDVMGFTVVDEKLSTKYVKYCKPIELPIKNVKLCLVISNIDVGPERCCVNLGFTILQYSHTFPDLCVFGSRVGS
ncbi:hypothetical protein CHS0354_014024 [Potamilus streckersoni]|uniref:Uncharacterized protein n=1 Tax=Potamilus streckersoni TaxID=2493646 RepID=A0AAE0TKB5_9BIVA|nr:hypothetical protein CHS0354_014024 [Potamilus streckersoni]